VRGAARPRPAPPLISGCGALRVLASTILGFPPRRWSYLLFCTCSGCSPSRQSCVYPSQTGMLYEPTPPTPGLRSGPPRPQKSPPPPPMSPPAPGGGAVICGGGGRPGPGYNQGGILGARGGSLLFCTSYGCSRARQSCGYHSEIGRLYEPTPPTPGLRSGPPRPQKYPPPPPEVRGGSGRGGGGVGGRGAARPRVEYGGDCGGSGGARCSSVRPTDAAALGRAAATIRRSGGSPSRPPPPPDSGPAPPAPKNPRPPALCRLRLRAGGR
jgi:hypothetical protein